MATTSHDDTCADGSDVLLSVENLRTYFDTDEGVEKAVDGISFELHRGKTLGIVGESGSGKTVTNLSIMGLIPQPPGHIAGGRIEFDGRDLLSLDPEAMRQMRGSRMAMIFQDPMTSLNPFMRVSNQMMEMTRLHRGYRKPEAFAHAVEMLELVGIPDAASRVRDYPHEFSGGMRQRVMIAMALSCDPELLIADEPTTALDVTIQAQILDLIRRMRTEMRTSVILVTHDLGVVAGMADEVVVMYAGQIFERAPTQTLFERPANPYTQGLLRSVPGATVSSGKLYQIPGSPPTLSRLGPGCPFAPRCDRATEQCGSEFPPFVAVDADHYSLCHFAPELSARG